LSAWQSFTRYHQAKALMNHSFGAQSLPAIIDLASAAAVANRIGSHPKRGLSNRCLDQDVEIIYERRPRPLCPLRPPRLISS